MQELNNYSLHHIGFAVSSMENSRSAFEELGAEFFHSHTDLERNLDFQFAKFAGGGDST